MQRVSTLSTGQRQKMNFARGLLNDPWVFFLDEPTLGLDVSAARGRARAGRATGGPPCPAGRSCSRPTTWPRPTSCASGSPSSITAGSWPSARPAELKRRVQRESIFRLELDRLDGGPAGLARPARGRVGRVAAGGRRCGRRVDSPDGRRQPGPRRGRRAGAAWSAALAGLGAHIVALAKSEPSLEDVFVELVGRGFDDGEPTPSRGRDGSPDEPHEAGQPEPDEVRVTEAGTSRRDTLARRRRVRRPAERRPAKRPTGPRQVLANNLHSIVGRAYPARHRADPRAVVDPLRDAPAVPDHVGLRVRLPRPRGARRRTSVSSCSAGR